MSSLSDLSPIQIRALIKLETPGGDEDSVGRQIGDLHPIDNMDVGVLSRLGLVVADEGRGGQVWVRLTDKGRKVRETGKA